MISTENLSALTTAGGNVIGSDGTKIGGIGQIYAADDTSEPTWVTVKTGLFGTHESFVPLDSATQDGNDIVVPYTKDKVKDAPRVAPDGHLEPEEEDQLYTYYERSGGAAYTGDRATTDRRTTDRETTAAHGAVGHDTSGPTTDDAMTRSEEQLHVGTEKQATGRARLRKYVVTENVTTTVPVQREEVRLEREPITEENRGAAMAGPAISEEEHEVILHEERPVVEKETVPVERVRLDKETVTEEHTVTEEVRKENIELDDDGRTNR
ncbi:Photosystem reaction center subunit H [Arthrobacter sp. 9AX]|uniref:YsnF/AvaK domain-containing protein n=1 Tax=Arthrobacter sp. 9AX TaxID=2653131 RepID=UPI0012EF2991|nr:YsnF/AvaK domain-containing protein [Arthrobacter sp. 9AX]VXC15933.1 Photosystem reaction center subunit H [Arthrobacter sp. 9AX]